MNKLLIIGVVVLVAVGGFLAFRAAQAPGPELTVSPTVSPSSSPTPSPTATPSPSGTVRPSPTPMPPVPVSKTVTISNFAFSPATVTIAIGGRVTWKADDSVSHQIVADSGLFQSGILQRGGEYTREFTKAGTYTYHCGLHSDMKGTVIVK